MISDHMELQKIRDAWDFIRDARNVIVGNCNVASIFAFSFNQQGMRDLCFTLLHASAMSVLEEVLQQLRDEGLFTCKRNQLSALMEGSKTGLPWVNYSLIDNAREARNRSIHERIYLPHSESRDYIAGIENELVAWGVLPSATPDLWDW